MAKKTSEKAQVYIIGESPMVEKYAELCARHGYGVVAFLGPQQKSQQPLGHGIKKSEVVPKNCSLGIDLTNTDLEAKRKNLQRLDTALPATSVILSSSVTVSATEQSGWIRGKHRLVGFCALPTLTDRPFVEVAPTVSSPKETLEVVSRFFRSVGKDIEIVQDRVGMVMPRILCQLVNESMFALMENVASPQDIDTAMKLGANYPKGPIEWAEKIGINQVYAVLLALQCDLGEDRYRVAPLLRQLAQTSRP
ncbi:MAG TPA: 3-hydroxyacyl-CoA dehydrogenase family protein, partial [Bacteroidota bacterium]|nr:3-hydroxyacyl-CoA dehydrogenase family protein [Bacteroidota bacterium]